MRRKKDFGAFKMILDPWLPGISTVLLQRGKREEAFMSLLERSVMPGMTVLDLGANIGYTTLTLANLVGSEGFVYAIEPDPRNYKLLAKNIKLNNLGGRVELSAFAVSDRTGPGRFNMARESNLSGVDDTSNTRGGKTIDMPLRSLDDYFAGRNLPAFMKMDIEGHEVEALRGFLGTIRNQSFPCCILMEIHPIVYTAERSFTAVLAQYFEAGFHTKYIVSAGVPKPAPFAALGYEPDEVFVMAGKHQRGVYQRITDEHAMHLVGGLHNGEKAARVVMIERA